MAPPKKPPQRCLYDVLELAKDCDEDAIKKAYRRMALQWHPDKNQHRVEEAQERFKEIHNAYEILSDRHERAWYDGHREQILRSGERHQAGGGSSGDGPAGGGRPDDEEELYEYFSSSCYSGYGDGARGFYGVYATIFAKLAAQEAAAREKAASHADGSDDERLKEHPAYPPFGASDATAAEVNGFYSAWTSFATAKEFAWADQYNPASAPNRQVRRKMEEENARLRKTERREFNAKVRELVAFVRKRDKRVAKYMAEEASRRAAAAEAEAAKQKAARAERLAKAAEYEEADWIRNSEAPGGSSTERSEEEEEVTELYCIVCEKKFKSDKQFANHERSKKHQERLAALREILEAEEAGEAGEPLEVIHEEDEDEGLTVEGGRTSTSDQDGAAPAVADGHGNGPVAKQHGDSRRAGISAANGNAAGMDSATMQGAAPTAKSRKQQKRSKQRHGGLHATAYDEDDDADEVNHPNQPSPASHSQKAGQTAAMQQKSTGGSNSGAKSKAQETSNPALDSEEEHEDVEEEEDEDEDAMLARMLSSRAGLSSSSKARGAKGRGRGGAGAGSGGDTVGISTIMKEEEEEQDEGEVQATGREHGQQEEGSGGGRQDLPEREARTGVVVEAEMQADSTCAGHDRIDEATPGAPAESDPATGNATAAPSTSTIAATTSQQHASKSRKGGKGQPLATAAPAAVLADGGGASTSDDRTAERKDKEKDAQKTPHGRSAAKAAAAAAAAGAAKARACGEESGDSDASDDGGGGGHRKGSKRKQKAAARKAQSAAADAVVAGKAATACGVCGVECGTRNKLFQHIKDSGHAVLRG